MAECEEIIQETFGNFIFLGGALEKVRVGRLYREGYPTFEACVKSRYSMLRAHAYRTIKAAQIVTIDLSPIGDTVPKHESLVRPLFPLDFDLRKKAWAVAIKSASDHPITADIVKRQLKNSPVKSPRQNQ